MARIDRSILIQLPGRWYKDGLTLHRISSHPERIKVAGVNPWRTSPTQPVRSAPKTLRPRKDRALPTFSTSYRHRALAFIEDHETSNMEPAWAGGLMLPAWQELS